MRFFRRLSPAPIFNLRIGLYKTRHPGRDGRDPDAMDGSLNQTTSHQRGITWLTQPFFSRMKVPFELFSIRTLDHIPVFWIPAIPAGMTIIQFVQYLLSECLLSLNRTCNHTTLN